MLFDIVELNNFSSRFYLKFCFIVFKVVNPSNAEATFVQSTRLQRFLTPSKPRHVGIHKKALTDYSQMSTHVLGFQSLFSIFASFCIGQSTATSSIRVKLCALPMVMVLSCFLSSISDNPYQNPFTGLP